MSFDDFPEKLKKIIFDLEGNYKVIQRIPEGILLINEKLFNQLEKEIYSNYNEKEIIFLQFIFNQLKKNSHKFYAYGGLLNNFNYSFPLEKNFTSISTGKKDLRNDEKTSETSGDSQQQFSPKEIRGRERVDFESIENIPLSRIPELVNKPIDDLQIFIDKETIKHFSTLTYKFDARDTLFDKITDHFKPTWNKQGWAWIYPEIGKKKKIRAMFVIKMHKYGRFTIPLKRGGNIKKFIFQFHQVFNFLDRAEFEKLLLSFDLAKKNEKAFVHLANKLSPKERIDKTLKGALVKINFIDFHGNEIIHVKVDYSQGRPEIEIEGSEPESLNLNTIITKPTKATHTLRGIAYNMEETLDRSYDLMKGQGILYNQTKDRGQTLQLFQSNIEKWQDEKDFGDELFFQQFQSFNGNIKKIGSFLNVQNDNQKLQLENEKIQIENQKIQTEVLKTFNNALEVGIDEVGQKIETLYVADVVPSLNLIEEKLNESKTEIIGTIEGKVTEIKDEIKEGIKNISDNLIDLKDLIESSFHQLGVKVKNNLYLVLRKLETLPGTTVKELSNELNRSKSTVYSYLKQLHDRNLIKNTLYKKEGPGRPKKVYSLSERARNIIKKIKK